MGLLMIESWVATDYRERRDHPAKLPSSHLMDVNVFNPS